MSEERYGLRLVIARKTLSSTGTACVKTLLLEVLPMAMFWALPLSAGPAGFAVPTLEEVCWEIRVVDGVQSDAPRQVSRTKTWRVVGVAAMPAAGAAFFTAADGAAVEESDFVTATKATKRPEELIEGSRLSRPLSEPSGSTETSCVDGVQPFEDALFAAFAELPLLLEEAPTHVSRR